MMAKFSPQQLSDLEEIRQLKHAYFRCIDTGNETELGTLFTEDVMIDLRGGTYRAKVEGRQNMVDFICSAFNSDIIAQHHGHAPEIRFTGPDSAEGDWYLQDLFIDPVRQTNTVGTAIYHDTYLRVEGVWKIARSEYDRVYEMVLPLDSGAQVTAHLLAKTGRKPEARIDISPWLEWYE
jgi:SnoaL-like domain